MKSTGIYLAAAGIVIIAAYILFEVIRAITAIPFVLKIGLFLLVVGGIILLISLVQERIGDSKKESFKGVKQ